MKSNGNDTQKFTRKQLIAAAEKYTVAIDGDNLVHSINAMIAETSKVGVIELKKPVTFQ